MPKAKVGDRIRTTERLLDEYHNGDEGEVTWVDADGACVLFPNKGRNIYIFDEDFVVIENDADTSFPDRKEEHLANKDAPASSAEAIRDNILRIREKRNDLKMEIIALDEEEAGLVEKLKQQGFVLYEQNVPETLATQALADTEKKAVLYAEDIEEDMSDPKNWDEGDIIECTKNEWITFEKFNVGETYEIFQIKEENDLVWLSLFDDEGMLMNAPSGEFKFRYRPL